jgi:2-polyprenyl-6-methoxyphenol hydroxylase-like FAD-dependent oxidoreductase
MPVRAVFVVGAGIAGLACALACARRGARVQVFEARAALARMPGHVDIVPNLLRDLAALGLAEECVREGFAYSGVDVVDEEGKQSFQVDTPRLAGNRFPAAVGIAHDALLDILARSAAAAGVELRTGLRVDRVDVDSGRVIAGGASLGADLVVLACGAESALVGSLFPAARRPGATHAWWHALLPRPPQLDRLTWLAGTRGRRFVLVPTGMSQAGIAVVRTADTPVGTDGAALVRTLAGWGALPRRIAALLDPQAPASLRFTSGRLVEAPWHRGAVLCVGSAAHGDVPAFGQSGAQAVEDAIVLGELVSAGIDRSTLLTQYMERRWERARRVHDLVEQAARWIEHPDPACDLMALGRELHAIVAQPA